MCTYWNHWTNSKSIWQRSLCLRGISWSKKGFDTVNRNILLAKLEHYGIKGNANYWLCSFLTDRKQNTSITGKDSNSQEITHGVLQGFVLGLLLFIIFINDLNLSITSSKVHHFADDTNLLLINKSLKKTNSLINHDLAFLVQWLRANRISLNTSTTDAVIFRPEHNNQALKLQNK